MIFRKGISFFAKKFYSTDYNVLSDKLLCKYKDISFIIEQEKFDVVIKVLISGEDHRFNYHCGFDLIAIFRAITYKLLFKNKQGASTIEQQLVRVLTCDYRNSIARKIKEIFLATTLSDLIPKSSIPLVYLHIAYYGSAFNSAEDVFKKFSNHKEFNIKNAAEIVSRIKYPENIPSNPRRLHQILVRRDHLIHLYQLHTSRKLFKIYK